MASYVLLWEVVLELLLFCVFFILFAFCVQRCTFLMLIWFGYPANRLHICIHLCVCVCVPNHTRAALLVAFSPMLWEFQIFWDNFIRTKREKKNGKAFHILRALLLLLLLWLSSVFIFVSFFSIFNSLSGWDFYSRIHHSFMSLPLAFCNVFRSHAFRMKKKTQQERPTANESVSLNRQQQKREKKKLIGIRSFEYSTNDQAQICSFLRPFPP